MASITTLPSGKIRVTVRHHTTGFYKNGTFTTPAEARAAAVAWDAEAQAAKTGNLRTVPKGSTLADLIDRYIQDTPKTYGRSKRLALELLKRDLGAIQLSKLSAVVLNDWVDKRLKAGAGGVTVAMYLSSLSSVLSFGKHARRLNLDVDLAKNARKAITYRGISTRPGERSREPTADELSKLYAYWAGRDRLKNPMQTICEFALASSMRLGEIVKLNVADFDPEASTIWIRSRKHPDPTIKATNDQLVPLLPDALAIVKEMVGKRKRGKVFEGVTRVAVSAAFTRAVAALGIEDLHFHDLRHAATAQFFRDGLDIPTASLLTGHRDWAMLRRYTKVTPADVLAKYKPAKKPTVEQD
ncbi:site-specific integrase [Variovorax ureilyticus]|uniref:Site-specific integrase n=1 Tax=Variovorax ureilyticus TaxID=1836198 RepID=A0ABU8VRB4_9BURK